MNPMIKISEAGSIAIHAMAFLASLEEGVLVPGRDIARTYGISLNHLHKVMQTLVKVRLVESVTGPNGGFRLARSADKIRLIEIYSAIEGGVSLKNCLLSKKFCMGKKCVFGSLLKRVNSEILEYFSNTTLADIVPSKKKMRNKYEKESYKDN